MPYVPPFPPAAYVWMDWTGNGDFTGVGEDVSADVLPGISAERGRDQGRVIGGPKVAKGGVTLSNESRRYAAEYSGSPLHGLLTPGRRCQFGRLLGSATVTMDDPVVTMNDPLALMQGQSSMPVFTGRTEEPSEHYGYGQRTVDVATYGLMQRLIDTRITVAYQATITTGNAMVMALAAAGLTSAEYTIDGLTTSGGRVLLHWFVDGRPAWDVCREIWATEGPPAALYEDALGVIHFEGRQYRATNTRCTTVQKTYTDTDPAAAFVGLEFEASNGSVINDMSIEVDQRFLQALTKVWEYGASITLGALGTITLIASTDEVLLTPQVPQIATDYLLPSGTLTSVTVNQVGPKAVSITFTAGAGGAVIDPITGNTGVQLRAQPLPIVSTVTTSGTVDTSASQALYGVRRPPDEIQNAIWKTLGSADAAGICDGYLTAYAEPRSVVRMTVEGANTTMLLDLLNRSVSDRIHVYDSWSGIDLDVSIEQIGHQIDSINAHRVLWHCERIVEQNWALWDVALWDVGIWGQ